MGDDAPFVSTMSALGGKAAGWGATVAKAFAGATLAAGSLAAAMGGKAVMAAGDFEAKMANVNSILGKDSAGTLAKLKDGILNLPPALGDATENAKGLYQALSSGVEPGKAVEFIAASAKLAKAGLAEMEPTVKVLTGVMNAYGEKTADVNAISDMMFKTVEKGVVELPELAAGLGQISSTAAAAGVSQSELMAAIAATTVKGVPAMQTMTSLKMVFANLIEPQEKALEAAKALGIEGFGPAMLEAKGFQGTLKILAEATGGNAAKMQALFGSVEAGNVALALAAQGGKVFNETLKDIQNSAGATDAALAKQRDTLTAKWGEFTVAVNKNLIKLGEPMLPHLKRLLDQATAMVERMPAIRAQVWESMMGAFEQAKTAATQGLAQLQETFSVELAAIESGFGKVWAAGKDLVSGVTKIPPEVRGILVELQATGTVLATAMRQNMDGALVLWKDLKKVSGDTFAFLDQEVGGFEGLVRGIAGTTRDLMSAGRTVFNEVQFVADGLAGTMRDLIQLLSDALAKLSQFTGTAMAVGSQIAQGNLRGAVAAAGGGKTAQAVAGAVGSGLDTAARTLPVVGGIYGYMNPPVHRATEGAVMEGQATTMNEGGKEETFIPHTAGSIVSSASALGSEAGGAFKGANKAIKSITAKLRKAVDDAADKGVAAGLGKGSSKGTKKDDPKSVYQRVMKAGTEGAVDGLIGGILSGDVQGALKGFVADMKGQFIKSIKEALMAGFGKKLLGGLGGFLGFASGGTPPVGRPFWVGERGPELMMIDRPSRVYSNEDSKRMVAGASTSVALSVGKIEIGDRAGSSRSPRETAQEILSELTHLIENDGAPRFVRAVQRVGARA